jgi:hypothetical protein
MKDQECRALADFMMASILALLRNPPHQNLLSQLLDSKVFAQHIFHEELPRYSTSEETISSATFGLHRLQELQFQEKDSTSAPKEEVEYHYIDFNWLNLSNAESSSELASLVADFPDRKFYSIDSIQSIINY